jgi:hypothetical protein
MPTSFQAIAIELSLAADGSAVTFHFVDAAGVEHDVHIPCPAFTAVAPMVHHAMMAMARRAMGVQIPKSEKAAFVALPPVTDSFATGIVEMVATPQVSLTMDKGQPLQMEYRLSTDNARRLAELLVGAAGVADSKGGDPKSH